ncbi:MAG: hypothetical protein JSV25_15010 [Spirochaetota bacterium]|nr:MAG: hypothetical protein JSV25_15010 [Spirochaetota bacterium]
MAVQEKFDIFVRYIRDSKRKIFSAAIIASIISVILFVAGSYWFLYYYYDSIVRDYYSSILRGVSALQQELIGKESYTEDLRDIANVTSQHKGVKHVWFTNRFGKLIYSTDSELLEQYSKKRLPADYYESIQLVWSFEGRYPKAHAVPIDRFLSLRYSIPLYAYGREDYDFIMGMDVKRFIYLPDNFSLLLLISTGYIVFFIALLFFPIFIWVRSRFSEITTQAKVFFGSMGSEAGRPAIPAELETPKGYQPKEAIKTPEESPATLKPQTPKEDEIPVKPEEAKEKPPKVPEETTATKKMRAAEKAPEKLKEEVMETKALKETKAPVKPEVAKEKPSLEVKEEGEKTQEADSLALFKEKKKDIFLKEDIELPFIHASSFVHHSEVLAGSYIYTHRGKNALYFTSFILPYKETSDALKHTDEMLGFLQQNMDEGKSLRELSGVLNSFCLERSVELNLSFISINEEDRAVQYSSYGSGYALYLKNDDDKVKELVLQMPKLGTVSKDKIDTISSFADIKFVRNDIFLLLPQNAAGIDLDGMNLTDHVKKEILTVKGQGAREITTHLSKPFETKSGIPQTGFVVFKFI